MSRAHAAVIGAGWAGLAAAVRLVQAGHEVTVFEMAPAPGGRARSVHTQGRLLDNGQHILVGAYTQTLRLMRDVGAKPEQLLHRQPLSLLDPRGHGFALGGGPARWAFAWAALGQRAWPLRARLSLLRHALAWQRQGFALEADTTVQSLCAAMAPQPYAELIDPLCVAALNTPASQASAQVFLRVLHDALLSGPGSADLLLPARALGELLAEPAWEWLHAQGARLRLRNRVSQLRHASAEASATPGWRVDGEPFDGVILACTAPEAARLALDHAPLWAAQASALRYEPILSVLVQASPGAMIQPMLRLSHGPAQFVFDRGALGGQPGTYTFVVSAAAPWLQQGLQQAGQAVLMQAREQMGGGSTWANARVLASLCERRATFSCVVGLQRPEPEVAPGLWAAADYVAGPYPATLEGAVRSGEEAARNFAMHFRNAK